VCGLTKHARLVSRIATDSIEAAAVCAATNLPGARDAAPSPKKVVLVATRISFLALE